MKKSSSYIFFDNPYHEEKIVETEENVIVIDNDCIRGRLIDALQLKADIIGLNFFKYSYNTKINSSNVNIKVHEVTSATYIEVEVSAKTQSKIVDCLEHFQDILTEINKDNKYVVITSYDFVSEYYCNKMYPKLNELERNLRKLLFNTYTLNFGLKYYEPTIDKSIQNKSKSVIKAAGSKAKKELKFIQEFPYSLDYNQVQELLFTKHWTKQDEKNKKDFLENNDDLSKLTDDELRKAYKSLEPKSEWDRLFANKVNSKIDFIQLFDAVRNDRNIVAHCKFFSKNDYNNCVKNVKRLNSEINKAIQITETHDFSAKNREQFDQSFARIKNSIEEFTKGMVIALSKAAQATSQVAENVYKSFGSSLYSLAKYTDTLSNQMIDDEDESNYEKTDDLDKIIEKFEDDNPLGKSEENENE